MYEQWKALVELQWPNGRKAVLDIAHDHVGTSQFHPLHGHIWEARFNHSDIAADIFMWRLRSISQARNFQVDQFLLESIA